jgi:hypothetical protein
VTFIIGIDGKVTEVKASADGETGAGAVARCLEQKVATWAFPATQQVTRVTFPLKFVPQQAAAPAAATPAATAPAAGAAAATPAATPAR